MKQDEKNVLLDWMSEGSVWLLRIYIFLENNKDPMTSSEATYISQFSTLLASSFWKRGGEKKINDFCTMFQKMCHLTIFIKEILWTEKSELPIIQNFCLLFKKLTRKRGSGPWMFVSCNHTPTLMLGRFTAGWSPLLLCGPFLGLITERLF